METSKAEEIADKVFPQRARDYATDDWLCRDKCADAVNEALEWAALECGTVGTDNGMEFRAVTQCINRIRAGKSAA